jgi:hypothetical protein
MAVPHQAFLPLLCWENKGRQLSNSARRVRCEKELLSGLVRSRRRLLPSNPRFCADGLKDLRGGFP